MYQSIPKPPIHLARVKLRTVGNLTQNEARQMGHLTFLSKRLSAVGKKELRNSLLQHVSRVHGSLLLSIPRGFLGSYEDPFAIIGGVCLSACRISRGLLGGIQ